MAERYFLWEDRYGRNYCVPVRLKGNIYELDEIYPMIDEYLEKWNRLFGEIESQLIRVEGGILTFENPRTV